jgi:hypothetical protein
LPPHQGALTQISASPPASTGTPAASYAALEQADHVAMRACSSVVCNGQCGHQDNVPRSSSCSTPNYTRTSAELQVPSMKLPFPQFVQSYTVYPIPQPSSRWLDNKKDISIVLTSMVLSLLYMLQWQHVSCLIISISQLAGPQRHHCQLIRVELRSPLSQRPFPRRRRRITPLQIPMTRT